LVQILVRGWVDVLERPIQQPVEELQTLLAALRVREHLLQRGFAQGLAEVLRAPVAFRPLPAFGRRAAATKRVGLALGRPDPRWRRRRNVRVAGAFRMLRLRIEYELVGLCRTLRG